MSDPVPAPASPDPSTERPVVVPPPAEPPAPTDLPTDSEPGIRARAFREVLKRALNQTLKGCTPDNVAQCFPTAAKARPGILRDVHKQLVGQYEKLGTATFEEVLAKYDTIRKLNELDVLIDEAKARKAAAVAEGITEEPIPPSTLPPTAILDAHLTPHLLRAQTALSERLTAVQYENEQLMDTIEKQEAKIRAMVAQLEKVVGGIEGTVKVVRGCVEEGKVNAGNAGDGVGSGGGGGSDVEMVDV